MLSIKSPDYPAALKQLHHPPQTLYYQGDLSLLSKPAIAVVGSRRMSGYGKVVTEQITSALVRAGVTVVSGLAFGVDTVAHQTTIAEGGKTIAVLGGGLDNIFPVENQQLAQQIAQKHGLLISEYPPGSPSLKFHFPARNRIIAGLSQAVIVTEAARGSGSLYTAKAAMEQGKEVYVVPGPITSATYLGCLTLIREGSQMVITIEELISDLGLHPSPKLLNLTPEEHKVLALLEEAQSIDDLHSSLHLPVSQLAAILIRLEMKGAVKNVGAGRYLKIC